MKQINHFILFLFIAAVTIIFGTVKSKAQTAGSELKRKIHSVENSLLPSVINENMDIPHWNILERMKHYKVPGISIAVINEGKVEWSKGYGFLSSHDTQKVSEGTLFQAASLTKPITALAVLQLVQDGALDLDEDVNKYLMGWKIPESHFSSTNKVTLRGILSHTAGLNVHGFAGYSPNGSIPTQLQVLNGEGPTSSGEVKLDTIPGTKFSYSGGGYVILQQLLEDQLNEPFENIMKKLVLNKLGMEHSLYNQPLPAQYHSIAAKGHDHEGHLLESNWRVYPEKGPGGLWTTPTDLAKYIIDIQKGMTGGSSKILTRKLIEQMLTKSLVGDWGLGPQIEGNAETLAFSHGGSNKGYKSIMIGFVSTGQGVVVMSNGENGWDLINEIVLSVSQVYKWKTHKPTIKN